MKKEPERKTNNATQQRKGTRIGFAEFAAVEHRNDGGKIEIAAYDSVNKPVSVGVAKETKLIAGRRYEIHEVEMPALNGDKFYQKDVWNEQHQIGNPDSVQNDPNSSDMSENPNSDSESSESGPKPSPLQVLKNFVDNIAADVRQLRDTNTAMWIVMIVIALLAIAGVLIR